MDPKASVIVPCWNVEKWVEDAVNSVLPDFATSSVRFSAERGRNPQ